MASRRWSHRLLSFVTLMSCVFTVGQDHCVSQSSAEETLAAELPRIAPLEPDKALASFVVLDGFRLELAAHEPLVRDPVAAAFDAEGRMYVVEMRGYSEQAEQNLGVVRLLTDTDGDGTFDAGTDFVDGLSWPTAVVCYDGGVFIGVAPDILYCKDTDGDGRADVRERVFTGFLKHNVQGLLNSFHWGVDNRIHGSASSCGGVVRRVGDDSNPGISLRGRDFSFDPRRLDLRAESGGAQHGMCFDAWGRKFVCSNSDHLQAVVIADRYFGRNPYYAAPAARESIAADGPQAEVFRVSPVEPWRIVRTRLRVAGEVPGPIEGGGRAAGYFTGATGATIYTGDAWPAPDHQQMWAYVGDVGSNIVHRKKVLPRGTSFIAERVDDRSEFIASPDIWFRPAQFCNGPDGCLYVLDVYREVIEHPDSLPPQIKQHLDLTSGQDRGRIYRIVPPTGVPRRAVSLTDGSAEELVSLLAHPNAWHRLTAARLLCERHSVEVVEELEALAVDDRHPLGQMHALYVLQHMGRLQMDVVQRAMSAPHPRVREHALVVSENLVHRDNVEAWIDAVGELANDDDPRVRMQAALACGVVGDERILDILLRVLRRDASDRWTRSAVYCSSASVLDPLQSSLASDASWNQRPEAETVRRELAAMIRAQQADRGRQRSENGLQWMRQAQVEPLRRPPAHQDRVDQYVQAYVSRAEPTVESRARGKKLFATHCSACHDAGMGDGGLGPNLASMKARGAEAIITNVLDPNREVNPQYVAYSVELRDGRIASGILLAETATSITLAKGRDEKKTVLKIEIERMQSTGKSLMPEDLHLQLTPDAMTELLSFLLDEGQP